MSDNEKLMVYDSASIDKYLKGEIESVIRVKYNTQCSLCMLQSDTLILFILIPEYKVCKLVSLRQMVQIPLIKKKYNCLTLYVIFNLRFTDSTVNNFDY